MFVDVQKAILRSYKYPWLPATTLKEDLDKLSRDKKAPPYPDFTFFQTILTSRFSCFSGSCFEGFDLESESR